MNLSLIKLGALEKEWVRPDMEEAINRFQPRCETGSPVGLVEATAKNKNIISTFIFLNIYSFYCWLDPQQY